MKIIKASSLALSILLLGAVSAQAETKLETLKEGTDAVGAKIVTEEKVKQNVDSSGMIETERVQESSRDPKGLMNKTKEKTTTESKIHPDGEREVKVESLDAAGTKRKYTAETEIEKHAGGGETTTVTSKEVVDPKGLLNKQSAQIKEETQRAADGTVVSKTVTKEVDGKVVADH